MDKPLRQTTLLFLLNEGNILLAMKKRGFGAGRWNGVGGKPDAGETIEAAAIRECHEEICVMPQNLREVARLDFFFPASKAEWDQQVVVYTCTEWSGDPVETEEMKPKWFSIQDIPYDSMWQDDQYWLPQVLANNYITASFKFDDTDSIVNQDVSSKPLAQ